MKKAQASVVLITIVVTVGTLIVTAVHDWRQDAITKQQTLNQEKLQQLQEKIYEKQLQN